MKSDSFDLRLSPRILIGKESFTPPVPAMPMMTPSGSSATLREEFKVKTTTETNRWTEQNKQTNKKSKKNFFFFFSLSINKLDGTNVARLLNIYVLVEEITKGCFWRDRFLLLLFCCLLFLQRTLLFLLWFFLQRTFFFFFFSENFIVVVFCFFLRR